MTRLFAAALVLGSIPALGAVSTIACSSNSHSGPTDAGTAESSTEEDAAEACTPLNQSDADLETPTVSFATDVLPIFQRGCGIAGGTCHGIPEVVEQQRPYLGDFDGGTDASVVVTGLVGVVSNEDPKMNLVTASSPETSFLMHKMDYDQCNFATDCAQGSTQYTNCGIGMPFENGKLPTATRDTVRRWIAQGAKNN